MPSRSTTSSAHAFTIMELLVAIAVATLLMFMINQLFMETSRAIQVGVRSGDILVESESIAEQIRRDARRMLPADAAAANDPEVPAGFLVIVNRNVPKEMPNGDPRAPMFYRGNVLLHEQHAYEIEEREHYGSPNHPDYDPLPWPRGGGLTLRDIPDPREWPDLRSDQLIFIADADRVADGRPFRSLTPRNEDQFHSDLTSRYARIWYGHAVRTQPDGSSDGGSPEGALGEPGVSEGYNYYPNRWTLARHQLLLAPPALDITSNDIYSQLAEWESPLVNADEAAAAPNDPFDGQPRLFHGLTDVTAEPLTGPDTTPAGNIVAWLNEASPATYPEHIEHYFLRNPGTPGARIQQMWANPTPAPMAYKTWQLAHSHPILTSNVSDFIVDFAGDYTADGRIDRIESGGGVPTNLVGTIKWYTYVEFANEPGVPGFDPRRPATYDGADAIAAYHAAVTPTPEGPYIIDGLNDDMDDSSLADVAYFAFRHDEPETWPRMIRIRYRMHDNRGNIQTAVTDPNPPDDYPDTYPIAGQWFEHIIVVPRP